MELDVITLPKQICIGIDYFLLNFFATFASVLGLHIIVTFGLVLELQVNIALQPPTRWEPFVADTMQRRPEPTKERIEATILSIIEISGVYKGRRARHLPRSPILFLGAPP